MASYFGIRIGSTTTCVAVNKEGKSDVLANDAGDRVTPAFISYNDGELSVGVTSSRTPSNVIMYIKRLLGHKDLENEQVKQILKLCPCKIVAMKEELAYELSDTDTRTTTKIGVQQALQLLFKQLMETATSHSGVQGERYAVLTIPHYFTKDQRRLMRNAASAVGFKILQVIHEPAASLMAHRIGDESEQDLRNENIVVFRVGGTSADATVVSVRCGLYHILSTANRLSLGGDKITELLSEHLAEEFKRLFKVDVQSNSRSMYKLRQAAETSKRVLSTLTTTSCSVDSLHDGIDFTCQISRARLESLLSGLIPKFLEVLEEALNSSNVKVENVDKVILCGGALKIPRLKQTVIEYFPNADVLSRYSPDEVLAIGAAYQAWNWRGLESVAIAEDGQGDEDGLMVLTITRPLYYKVFGGDDQELIFDIGTPVPAFKEVPLLRDSESDCICLEIYELQDGSTCKLADVTMKDLVNDAKLQVSFNAARDNSLEVTLQEHSSARIEKLTIK